MPFLKDTKLIPQITIQFVLVYKDLKLFIPLYARKKYQGEYTTKIPKKLPFSIVAIKIKDGQPVIARYDVLKYKAVVHTDFDFVTSTQKGLPAHFE